LSKKKAQGVKGMWKREKLIHELSKKKYKLSQKREEILFKAVYKTQNDPKKDLKHLAALKDKYKAAKIALGMLESAFNKEDKKYKKVHVAYLISIGKIKPPKILTP